MASDNIQTVDNSLWRNLRLFNFYRLSLALLFYSLGSNPGLLPSLGGRDPDGFYLYSFAYFCAAFFAMFPLLFKKPNFNIQLHIQTGLDIFFITMLMHYSGGLSSGMGLLLIVTIANNGSLVFGRTPLFFAASAAIAILIEQIVVFVQLNNANFQYAGFIGLALFLTAIITQVMARRVRETHELAEKRSIDLANMAQLTDYVITHIDMGVIAVDPDHKVHLMNSAAQQLLGIKTRQMRNNLKSLCPDLNTTLTTWLKNHDKHIESISLHEHQVEIMPQFEIIGVQQIEGILIFLHDHKKTLEQAQQIKLAALGRLVASIAHEIRNPLGAIGHANELLSESPDLDSGDQRLTDIINNNVHRLNIIVENILQLGRRTKTEREEINIYNWLTQFVGELNNFNKLNEDDIKLTVVDKTATIFFDTGHLHQILSNLSQNGLRHALDNSQPKLEIIADSYKGETIISVIDSGPGINKEHLGEIFEPFFTTNSKGTGLGLYISKELASSNYAELYYDPTIEGQSCFKLKIT